MNITLTPDIEQVLRQAAKKQGATVHAQRKILRQDNQITWQRDYADKQPHR